MSPTSYQTAPPRVGRVHYTLIRFPVKRYGEKDTFIVLFLFRSQNRSLLFMGEDIKFQWPFVLIYGK